MIIRRVDRHTINCIITEDDLQRRGISVEEIFRDRSTAMELLNGIVHEASRQLGFKPDGQRTTLTMSVLPDHSLSLTIRDSALNTDEMPEELEAPEGGSAPAPSAGIEEMLRSILAGENSRDEESTSSSLLYMVHFRTMTVLTRACRALYKAAEAGGITLRASLYRGDREGYDLVLMGQEDQQEGFEKLVLTTNEFGRFITSGPEYIAHIREHAFCIIKGKAVETLAQL